MTHDLQRSDVAFLDFERSAFAARSAPTTIAVFPRPASRGRPRVEPGSPREGGAALIGRSPAMVEVTRQLHRIAASQASVMLVGESGTGKEVAAEMLHSQSARANAPFVAVNCGAVPANLVEAEMFGYERGAFTGAVRQHQGYFERADRGTLFLDEITEMPFELQAKLLRVLETGRLVRVGGSEEIEVDVRVVTASNHDAEAILRDRRLREDLYFRLAVFMVRLPALRERGQDIELLAQVFLDRLNREHGTSKHFDSGALALARAHSWPGNVRELKNCVERSFVLCDAAVALDLQPVPLNACGEADWHECVRVPIGATLAEAEQAILLATLRHCGGSRRRTAEMLGVSVKTVYNKLVGHRGEPAAPDILATMPPPSLDPVARIEAPAVQAPHGPTLLRA
jgi:DNA-binding NtrC family response regulator